MSILEKILVTKRQEVTAAKRKRSLVDVKSRLGDVSLPRPFAQSLITSTIAIIAEIKKASPSKGLLVEQFDHRALAREYEAGGARALSVLTDHHYFQGRPEFIGEIKSTVRLPVLRKEFIIDEYQVYESRLIGADAILLIVKALTREALRELYECASSIGLQVLVEAHSAEEIELANNLGAMMIGVNNRDLTTFEVSLQRSIDLRRLIRDGAVAISESGIHSKTDVQILYQAGYHAVLIGEGLVSKRDRIKSLQELAVH